MSANFLDGILDGRDPRWLKMQHSGGFRRATEGNRRRMQRRGGNVSCFDHASASAVSVDPCQSRERGDVFTRIVEQLGHNPDHVCGIRVTESEINVDLIDFDDPDWPATTARHVDLRSPPLILPGLEH